MYREIAAIYVWTAGAHFVVNLVVQLKCASSSVQRNTTKSRRHQQDENDKADAGAQNPAERVPATSVSAVAARSAGAPCSAHARPMDAIHAAERGRRKTTKSKCNPLKSRPHAPDPTADRDQRVDGK